MWRLTEIRMEGGKERGNEGVGRRHLCDQVSCDPVFRHGLPLRWPILTAALWIKRVVLECCPPCPCQRHSYSCPCPPPREHHRRRRSFSHPSLDPSRCRRRRHPTGWCHITNMHARSRKVMPQKKIYKTKK